MESGTERMPRFAGAGPVGGHKGEPCDGLEYDGLGEKKMGDPVQLMIVEIIGVKTIRQMK
jgi:hypothetical protein